VTLRSLLTCRIAAVGGVLLVLASAGYLLFGNTGPQESPVSAPIQEVWTCSMHPQVRMPGPGSCPICSMPLVKVETTPSAKTGSTESSVTGEPPVLKMSEQALAMAGVETVPVRRGKLSHEIRVTGKVEYNETSVADIAVRVEGYVERLFVDYTGIEVNAGDHLVEIYSPDLLVAQQELLTALKGPSDPDLIESARRKLMLRILTQAQVDVLVRDGKVSDRITLFSPIQGVVIEKRVVQNTMVKPGDVLYRLVNLESVWVYLNIYEYELAWVQYGQTVEIRSEAIPDKVFTGRIWFISPTLDEETRTVKALCYIDNAGRRLKPGMYVRAVIRAGMRADGSPRLPTSKGCGVVPCTPW